MAVPIAYCGLKRGSHGDGEGSTVNMTLEGNIVIVMNTKDNKKDCAFSKPELHADGVLRGDM